MTTRKSSADKIAPGIRRATRKNMLLKKMFLMHSNGYVAQRVYLTCTVETASMRAFIIVGQKTFWKLSRSVCQAIQCAKRRPMRLKTCLRRKPP